MTTRQMGANIPTTRICRENWCIRASQPQRRKQGSRALGVEWEMVRIVCVLHPTANRFCCHYCMFPSCVLGVAKMVTAFLSRDSDEEASPTTTKASSAAITSHAKVRSSNTIIVSAAGASLLGKRAADHEPLPGNEGVPTLL
jgi:hypothetical protein